MYILYRTPILLLFLTSLDCFSQDRMILSWNLFKNDKPVNAKHEALLRCGIDFAYKVRSGKGNLMEVQFDVKGGIDTAKSYFNFDLKNKDYKLLNHEQGHADIAVIYSVQLKKRLKEMTYYKSNYSSVIKRLFDEYVLKMNNKQLQYDEETNHGKDYSIQDNWDAIFKKELNIQ